MTTCSGAEFLVGFVPLARTTFDIELAARLALAEHASRSADYAADDSGS